MVDFSSAIIFLISFFYGFELFFDKKNFKKNLKFFLLISSILLTFKTSNLIFIIYIFFIIFYFLLKNYLSFKRLLSISVLPLLLLILWVIKTFINTSCLIFPLLSSCFNTEWSDVALVNNIVNEIINYGRAYTSSINISVIINFILSFIEIFNLIFFNIYFTYSFLILLFLSVKI